jgi:hypothetical protein
MLFQEVVEGRFDEAFHFLVTHIRPLPRDMARSKVDVQAAENKPMARATRSSRT